MSELYTRIDAVDDAESFAAFVSALRDEVKANAEASGPFAAESFDPRGIWDFDRERAS